MLIGASKAIRISTDRPELASACGKAAEGSAADYETRVVPVQRVMPVLRVFAKGIRLAVLVPVAFFAALVSALLGRTGAEEASRSGNQARRERRARERAAREAEDIDHDDSD